MKIALSGKTALVTGSTAGIGLAIAAALAAGCALSEACARGKQHVTELLQHGG